MKKFSWEQTSVIFPQILVYSHENGKILQPKHNSYKYLPPGMLFLDSIH